MIVKAEELVGRTVAAVFREELSPVAGGGTVVALQLDDGRILYALADAEGNGAGALYLDDARTSSSNLIT